jgi:serine-type D-Ala-D-Ala carboxypeptidase/endopeptidase
VRHSTRHSTRYPTHRGIVVSAAIAALSVVTHSAQASAQAVRRSMVALDTEIQRILVRRIDEEHQSVGIVVGVVDAGGRRIISYGQMGTNDPRPVDGNTVYEIGSISKIFTSLLLADMARRGEVTLDEPVARLLPEGIRVPTSGGRQITLTDLATHTSGLPPMPTNFAPRDPSNPYVDYTVEKLFAFLSGATLTGNVGAQWEYSNLGGGLLGMALARRANTDYESAVAARILAPLGMRSTAITLTADLNARFATGHNATMHPTPHWTFAALEGAGAWRSTANDLLTFLAANIGLTTSPLDSAMADMRAVSRPGAAPTVRAGLGWGLGGPPGHSYVFWGGTTTGFQSFIVFDPARRVGIVVLSNVGTPIGVGDIGLHLLDPALPLFHAPPPREHTAVPIDSAKARGYVGRYELMPNVTLTITREGTHMYGQVSGQGRFELFQDPGDELFAKVTDLQFTFDVDDNGRVVAAVQHQAGVTQRWRRIE